jgi:probable rRNA maturation factor
MNKPKSQNMKNFIEKIIKTFIHGYLHLLGFDHIKNIDYKKMLIEEDKIYKSVISKISKFD